MLMDTRSDLEVLVQHIKFIKSLAGTEPWKSGIACETYPGPNCSSDEDIRGENIKSLQRSVELTI